MSICDPHKCSWHFPNRVFNHKLDNTAINIISRSTEKHTTQIKGIDRIEHYLFYSLAIIRSIWGLGRSSPKRFKRYNQQRYPTIYNSQNKTKICIIIKPSARPGLDPKRTIQTYGAYYFCQNFRTYFLQCHYL